jgi:hypothetical protein
MKACPCLLAAALCALGTAVALAAYSPGGTAYTKRAETALLADHSAVAETVARVGYAHQLKVEEVSGLWLRVSEGGAMGWVFAGNVAEQEPSKSPETVKWLGATTTSAAAAARPLAPASVEYANRRNLGEARGNLDWLRAASAKVTDADVQAYMQANHKGEFQP